MSEEDQQSKPSMHEMKSMLQETKKEILNEVQVILQETKDEFDGLDEPKEEGNWCIPGKGKYVGARNEVAAMEQFRRYINIYISLIIYLFFFFEYQKNSINK